MKIINKTLVIFFTILLLNSCSGFKLKKKSSSGEEFLIEKKDPLILPPDFSELPEPNEQKNQSIKEDDQIKLETIFNDDSSNNNSDDKETKSGLKDSVLKKIQKQ
jgi:PBP1b-binding outer membrane lipoprotein LpoB